MPKSRYYEPLDDNSGWLVCPKCGERKYWSRGDADNGGEWYVRWRYVSVDARDEDGQLIPDAQPFRQRIKRPSAYCRICTNKLRTEQNQARRAIERVALDDPNRARQMEADRRTPCDSCGLRAKNKHPMTRHPAPLITFCDLCWRAYWECEGNIIKARRRWLALRLHCTTEDRLNEEWTARHPDGFRRKDHWTIKPADLPLGPTRHYSCVEAEMVWRHLMQWLNVHVDATRVDTGYPATEDPSPEGDPSADAMSVLPAEPNDAGPNASSDASNVGV